MRQRRSKPLAECLATVLAGLALVSCGGEEERKRAQAPDRPAQSDAREPTREVERSDAGGDSDDDQAQFTETFERLTGVSLRRLNGGPFGTRLEPALEPSRFDRFGAYSFMWTRDDRRRELFLEDHRLGERGIYWKRIGTSFAASKPMGDRLVLRWVGRPARRTTPQWDRLERTVRAAVEDDLSLLTEAERPCDDPDDPLEEDTGACSLRGIPVTFVDAEESLSTPAFDASVLGIDTIDRVRTAGLPPLSAKGRFVIVAYRVRNKTAHPISFVQPYLQLRGRRLQLDPDATARLRRSGSLPLQPGATLEGRVAFDLQSPSEAQQGALVLPADRNGRNEPSLHLAQGWIRLSGARQGLPRLSGRATP